MLEFALFLLAIAAFVALGAPARREHREHVDAMNRLAEEIQRNLAPHAAKPLPPEIEAIFRRSPALPWRISVVAKHPEYRHLDSALLAEAYSRAAFLIEGEPTAGKIATALGAVLDEDGYESIEIFVTPVPDA